MRKFFAILLAVMLIAAMSVTAFAVTPKWEYKPVKIPVIKVDTGFLQSAISRWLIENPIELPDIDIKFTSKTLD